MLSVKRDRPVDGQSSQRDVYRNPQDMSKSMKGRMAILASSTDHLFESRQDPCASMYEGHLETKERFAIQRYLLIIGKKQNMQVLSHTFTYFST